MKSPYAVFNEWLFDRERTSPIPKPKFDSDGKILIPDILKYNSPINHTFVIKLFVRNIRLNYYLNKYFNNINLRYLDKSELFIFIKQCVIDFKIKQRDLMFYHYHRQTALFEKLRNKMPMLKNHDIYLLIEIIEKSNERDNIYTSLGIDKPKIQKNKKGKIRNKGISSSGFIKENFSIMDYKN